MHSEPRGRVLRTHGPFTYVLIALCALSSLCSIAAVVFTVLSLTGRVDANTERLRAIQDSRIAAAEDTCHTLQTVIKQAYAPSSHTTRVPVTIVVGNRRQKAVLIVVSTARPNAAAKVIKADDLADCNAHAKRITALRPSIRSLK